MEGIRGLYAITPDWPLTERLLEAVRKALEGGARIVQYRNKSADRVAQLWQGQTLRSLTRAHDALLIVNDSPRLARALDADGVHLGKDDGEVAAARGLLGKRLIGVSCYDDLQRALTAQAQGADYVAFGAAYPSPTKLYATRAPLALFAEAKRVLDVPVVAIGGISPENARPLVDVGVDALALVSGLFDATDITAAARQIAELFATTTP
jgi:thiamine-phosphate pyrophosphorylase